MDFKKSLEEIEKLMIELQEENKIIPILVEGDKDVQALRKLGIKGRIIIINTGKSLSDFCDSLVKDYKNIIILTDWDRKGGHLCQILRRNLNGRINCNTSYREYFARNSMIRTVEGLPSWIETMKEKLNLI
jgi:5S rRNA maturation endonuclease (ribonuclease M5)